MIIEIEPRYGGMTVREFVKTELGLSRGLLTRLKSCEMGIMLNGTRVTVRAVLKGGDMLELASEDGEGDINGDIEPVPLPLDVIYEDADIVAVNKAAGMPTHPSHDHHGDTLANALAYHYAEMGVPFVFRAINRLDRDTSGIVLVARNRAAAYKMSRQLTSGQISKRYIAVTDGIPSPAAGIIDAPIRRKPDSVLLRECCAVGEGAEARTEYETVCVREGRAVALVRPLTGRTHQIRVHFAHIGCPLTGDYLYGEEGSAGMRRHALHAFETSFDRLSDGGRIILSCPPPEDIRRLAESVGFDGDLSQL